MLSVKVSTKHQIVVPSEARHRLGIEAGDRLAVTIEGDAIILRPRPESAARRLRGLGRGMYEPDPDTYLRRLREDTEERVREREASIARAWAERPPAGRT